MKKDLIIKIAIGVLALVFGYSVFWFFKAGQIEKQLNRFISENSANISVAEVSISGFPIAQKISLTDLKFSIPTPLFNKKQVLVRNLEATSSVFGTEFKLSAFGQVSVTDIEKGNMNIEFSKDPEISFTVSKSGIEKFSYQDMGYRIIDNEKAVYYSASRSQINITSTFDEQLKNIIKITGNINDVEGYTVVCAYKSSLEKKIIEGIKTEEIVIGSSPIVDNNVVKPEIKVDPKKPLEVAGKVEPVAPVVNPSVANAPAPAKPEGAVAPAINPANPATVTANVAPANPAPTTDASSVPSTLSSQQVPNAITDSNIVKSNITIDIEYQTSSNEAQSQIPNDPSQLKEMAIQSNKVLKINNIEFSNPLYKLFINGQLNILPDDNLPSGGVSVKVENIDNLVNQIVTQLGLMANLSKSPNPDAIPADNSVADVSINEAYNNFLRRIAINLSSVNKEISGKNPVSKESVAQYDIRREKNLDFIVNEVSIHEILGKF